MIYLATDYDSMTILPPKSWVGVGCSAEDKVDEQWIKKKQSPTFSKQYV